MQRWRTSSRLPLLLDALGLPAAAREVERLVATLGGAPVSASERSIGEPAVHSRRLRFDSGGEIILRDGVVAGVLLHLTPTRPASRGIDLATWIDGVTNDATLEDLTQATGAERHFSGIRTPYLDLGDGFARLEFADSWNDPGQLRTVVLTASEPGLAVRPEDDDCPACSDLLVRDDDGGVDVGRTVDALAAAVAAGDLKESARWVPLADLRPLHASGLMARAESQLTCRRCQRISCFVLPRDGSPEFGYHVLNDAMRHPMEPIPPVDQWGDAARLDRSQQAMRYVDHQPAAWFLVARGDELFLDARYTISTMAEDSALIRLDESELVGYRADGHAFVDSLARAIDDSSPHRESSPYYARDLYRGPHRAALHDEVAAATVNHTWLAEQRRPR